jgi:hypothetical protein
MPNEETPLDPTALELRGNPMSQFDELHAIIDEMDFEARINCEMKALIIL